MVRPIEKIGQRSLDSYIIQAVFAVIVPSFWLYDQSGIAGQLLAIVALLACWGWAEVRAARKREPSSQQRVPAPANR